MTRAQNEMIQKLASLLGPSEVKTAAKKDDDKEDKKDEKCCKCGKEDCKCGCKGDADKCKCEPKDEDKKKKAEVIVAVMNDLVKLADGLDDIGAGKASDMVDDALKHVVAEMGDEGFEDELSTEMFEEDEPFTGREWGMGTRVERTLQDPSGEDVLDVAQPPQEDTPEGLGMEDFNEHGAHEDKLDELFNNPEFRAKVKELIG